MVRVGYVDMTGCSSTGRFITVSSGVKLYYRMHGLSKLPCIVLFNGLLSDSTVWVGLLPYLSPFYRVLTFDSRGQGRSDAPLGEPYTTQLLAEDTWDLLQHLEIQKPWLVGLSNGSAVGVELLVAHPGAFSGAVLASAVSFVDFSMQLRLRHWLHCLELGGVQMQFDAVAPYIWSDRFLKERFNFLKKYYLSNQKHTNCAFVDLRYQIEGALSWDIRSRLGSIDDKVLVLMGDRDLLTPVRMGSDLAMLIKYSEFEIVQEASHMFPVESPKLFAKKIHKFITKSCAT